MATAKGLAEATAAGAYVATVGLRLLYEDGATVDALIDVHAAVYADARAARSVLGAVTALYSLHAQCVCNLEPYRPLEYFIS